MKGYYDKNYFEWQKKAGVYGSQQDLWMYEKYVKNTDSVLDFGCGGGYMIAKLNSRLRCGVDINQLARIEAKKNGVKVYEKIGDIPKRVKFDVIISHHALEHVSSPYEVLVNFKKCLKRKGVVVCVVPIDDWRKQKKSDLNDVNKHLYTWTPLLISNLFLNCGYKVVEVKIIQRAWVPLSRFYYKYVPKVIYNFISFVWSSISFSRQIRIVAKKG